ncbi:hypothetical protein [Sulfitobacter sp.]|uniref:hypothetical protein n=1 Tax=Sulfitobacter sp. TaxID=1903071 RepID=UPI003001264E
MVHKNKVIQSVNGPDGFVCVDVFRRPDGSFGFDEFRRDPEDNRGWYSIGHHGSLIFANEVEARAKAKETINWFAEL